MSGIAVSRHRTGGRPLRTVAVLLCAIAAVVGAAVVVAEPWGAPVVAPAPAPAPTPVTARIEPVGPGQPLRSGAECADLIPRHGVEQRPENARPNATPGAAAGVAAWPEDGYAPELNAWIVPRIDGVYTGTTDEILQWGACKWGFPADVVRAMAAEESGWRQSTVGDVSADQADCVAGATAPCPTSFGIMQVKHLFRPGSYPLSAQSTAFNVDYALGAVRACYEGWVTYLDNGYAAGDLWGCLGWHFSGEWRDPLALDYIARVQGAQSDAPWTRW